MADVKYDLVEQNNSMYAQCPNCSRLHATTDDKNVPVDVPSKCRRCQCPMDKTQAVQFADANAKTEHNPALAKQGKRLRSEEAVPA